MNTKIIPKSKSLSRIVTKIPLLDRISKIILLSKLKKIKHGIIKIVDQDETLILGSDTDIEVTITINKSSFYSRTLIGGSIGNAESYIDNDWNCSSLTNLVRISVINRDILQQLDSGLVNFFSPFQKIFHGFRLNTLRGSKRNIRSHYDMGNDFFQLFLDPSMMYSCAIFESAQTPLEDASIQKINTVCEKLKLSHNDHLLEIGTGWGSMAIYAAQTFGCRVTTTTISQEQFDYTQSKVKALGLEDKVVVLFEDYRKLQGTYDKLVSIEMIEAVGLDNLDTYFEVCSRLLKENGLMVLQAITIRDQYYQEAKKSVDFIQRHIFPGSGIPSINAILNSLTKKSNMVMIDQQDYAEDYAMTLNHWSKRFRKKKDEVMKLGYPDFLPRLWEYYFAYCEGGFLERSIGLSQIVLAKPEYKNRSLR